ncbi:MAG: hypothetical protein ABEJ55_08120 [Halanaeroarchaeum sp.]
MYDRSTRRQFLRVGTTASLVALAGCSTENLPDDLPDTGGNSSVGLERSGPGPEATTRRFLEAVANANQSRIEELTYEAASIHPEQTYDITIDRVDRIPLSAAIESSGYDLTQSEIDALESGLRSAVSAAGGDDFAVVAFSVQFAEAGQDSGHLVLIERDGAWRIYAIGLQRVLDQTAPQTDTHDTTTREISTRIQVVSAVGLVRDGAIGTVRIVVVPAPGSERVDLGQTTIQWVGPAGSQALTYAAEESPGSFTVETVSDDDGSIADGAVLTPGDRAVISIDVSAIDGSLGPGASATLTIRLPSGAAKSLVLRVPDTLSNQDAVAL